MFVDFSEAFDSIHRGKMEQILLTYSLPKETVEIVAGVLQGDTLAPYLFIISLDYVL